MKKSPAKHISAPKFKSKFEQRFWEKTKLPYEQDKLDYVVPASKHKYTPDFKIPGTNIYLETKGRFGAADRKKHLLIKAQHPDKRIIIVFQSPKQPICKGSKTTCAEWAEKNGIEWMTVEEAVKLSPSLANF